MKPPAIRLPTCDAPEAVAVRLAGVLVFLAKTSFNGN